MPCAAGALPAPTGGFRERKARILRQLAAPAGEYADASPKGSVDAAIRPLLDDVNGVDGFVTTSSCAGRVSVFLEGRRATGDDGDGVTTAGVGGKGGGGTWLFVSHEAGWADGPSWLGALGFAEPAVEELRSCPAGPERRLIHFKFEPMILHVLTASPAHAQLLLRAGLQAGFRESGAVSLVAPGEAAPVVAIRSLGLGFESLIGYEAGGRRHWLVSAAYLDTLREVADERLAENARRIQRFRAAFFDALAPLPEPTAAGGGWEDAAARRERMRVEGLKRKAALAAGRQAGADQAL